MVRPVDMTALAPQRHAAPIAGGRWAVTVTPPAVVGGRGRTVVLTGDQYARYLQWRARTMLLQDALPELSASEREALMTGLTDAEFQEAAGDEDNEDEE